MTIGATGRGLLLGLGLAAAAAACGGMEPAMSDARQPEPATPDRIEVEADLFSGRPNPSWSLSVAEMARWRRLVARLPPAAEGAYPSRLGYRGLRLTLSFPGREAGTAEVADGRLRLQDGEAAPRVLADPGREVERWLVATGHEKVEAGLYATVAAEAERIWNQEKRP